MSTIGTRIRDLRVSKGMTQTALSGNGISCRLRLADRVGQAHSLGPRWSREIAEPTGRLRRGDPAIRRVAAVVDPRLSDDARLDVNFAQMALANGNPAEARASSTRLDLDDAGQHRRPTRPQLCSSQSLEQTGDMAGAVARAAQRSSTRNRRERGLGRPRARRHHASTVDALRVR